MSGTRLTRRQFVPRAAAAGLALSQILKFGSGRVLGATANAATPDRANWPSNNKIKHVVILCQENRSFDHYFGAFASMFGNGNNQALGFNPAELTYYNSTGQGYQPYQLTQFCNQDPDHGWEGSHAKWNSGAMNGWVTDESGQTTAIGYFEPADHIYHVKLAQAFTISDHHFCPQIGPTLPNRLYLRTGTSGWNYMSPTTTSDSLPYNNPSLTAVPPILSWPTMPDVLDAARLPWKCYSVADGSIPSVIGAFNPLRLAQATTDFSQFSADLADGTLPAVSWIVTEAVVCEHPPAPPDMGQLLAALVVEQLMASSAWESTALFLTYDEGGGFFEHVPPNVLEFVPSGLPDGGLAVGPAFRVPLIAVSPWVQPGTVYNATTDHTSVLQFIEQTFSNSANPLYLSSIDPARRELDDLTDIFDFTQQPIAPAMPTVARLWPAADKTLLTLNLARTLASCSTTAPQWLDSLLGV